MGLRDESLFPSQAPPSVIARGRCRDPIRRPNGGLLQCGQRGDHLAFRDSREVGLPKLLVPMTGQDAGADDGGREERPPKDERAHLLQEHGQVRESHAGPAKLLGHDHPQPTHLRHGAPYLIGEAAFVRGHGARVAWPGRACQEFSGGAADDRLGFV